MNLRIINQEQVESLLAMDACIGAMEEVLRALAEGDCDLPLRRIMWLPEKIGALGLMPAYWRSRGIIGLKAVTYFPGNEGTDHDTHQGAVLLYEAKRGRLMAMVDATSITAIRTAAVSGVATKLLARKNASRLAIIGSGVQAGTHLAAMCSCRDIKHVRVCSKTPDRAEAFAEVQSGRRSIPIEAVASVADAVDGADIICTTTSATEPVLMGEWISPGAHINAVGSSVATARELDGEAVKRSTLFVDRRESALTEAGDFLLAKTEGLVGDDHIRGELGELLIGAVPGRTNADQITLFKSVGLALEDLAAALCVYEAAQTADVGATVCFGGNRREAH